MKGKLIVIEGTDCSGKETQTNLLINFFKEKKIPYAKYSFPNYETPTGKIIGGPYLGKEAICEGWFKEEAHNVDPKVSSLYYAADRKYNIDKIIDCLENGINVIIDRYTYSNMAHQGGKIEEEAKRYEMYVWLDKLEFKLLELPKADLVIFLHLPFEYSLELKKNRIESLDQNEKDERHLKNAEIAYLELAKLYNWKTVECVKNDKVKSIEEISSEVIANVMNFFNND